MCTTMHALSLFHSIFLKAICHLILHLFIINTSESQLSFTSNAFFPKETEYSWNNKQKFYFPNLHVKMKETLYDKCMDKYSILPDLDMDSSIALPKSPTNITVMRIPVSSDLVFWWKSISRPQQMRVSPLLCDIPYTKERPIFNNTGCLYPSGFMVQSSPRCQTGYMKWACDNARTAHNVVQSNGFILPEADHAKMGFIPPQPFVMGIRDAFIYW